MNETEHTDVLEDLSKYVKNVRERIQPTQLLTEPAPAPTEDNSLLLADLREKIDVLTDVINTQRELSHKQATEQADWRKLIITELANLQAPKLKVIDYDAELEDMEKEVLRLIIKKLKGEN